MKNLFWGFLSVILCVLTATNTFTSEQTKPTREQIIEFLEDYRNNHPFTEDEKMIAGSEREKINLVEHLGTDFSGLDLSGIDFREFERWIILHGVDFSGCNLQGTSFFGSVLTECNFSDTNLANTSFRFCELNQADFSRAKLNKTVFAYSKMQNAVFADLDASTCHFETVKFIEAKLMRTNFSGAKLQYHNDFPKADLTGANLSGANLYYSRFQGANLKNVSFRNANLHLADFTGANLEGTDFTGANLEAAIFADVTSVDDDQRQALLKQSARWWYDLKEGFYDFLKVAFYPFYLLIAACAITFSIIGHRKKEDKTRSFRIAELLNGFAVFSTLCTLMILFSGGHPVRQMSQGNYNAWSTWLSFFPIPMLGLMICIVISFILLLLALDPLVWNWHKKRRWGLFFYQILTLVHCLLAFNWLIMFMPDA